MLVDDDKDSLYFEGSEGSGEPVKNDQNTHDIMLVDDDKDSLYFEGSEGES